MVRHVIHPHNMLDPQGKPVDFGVRSIPIDQDYLMIVDASTNKSPLFRSMNTIPSAEGWLNHLLRVAGRTKPIEDMLDAVKRTGAADTAGVFDQVAIDFAAVCVVEEAPASHGQDQYVPWISRLIDPVAGTVTQHTVSLYPRHLGRFTGIHPGAVIWAAGNVMSRTANMSVPERVALRAISVADLPPSAPPSLASPGNAATAKVRVLLAAGPFVGVSGLNALQEVARAAASRKARAVVFVGPFTTTASDPPKPLRAQLEDAAVSIAAAITECQVHGAPPLEAVMVPSLDEPISLPLLPQRPLASDDPDRSDYLCRGPENATVRRIVRFASNPCELQLAGAVRIAINGTDVASLLEEVHLERGVEPKDRAGNLLRTAIRTGLRSPVVPGIDHRVAPAVVDSSEFSLGGTLPHVYWTPNARFATPVVAKVADHSMALSTPFANIAIGRWSACEVTLPLNVDNGRPTVAADSGTAVIAMDIFNS